jgi:hypothetical protein
VTKLEGEDVGSSRPRRHGGKFDFVVPDARCSMRMHEARAQSVVSEGFPYISVEYAFVWFMNFSWRIIFPWWMEDDRSK